MEFENVEIEKIGIYRGIRKKTAILPRGKTDKKYR